MPHRGSVPERIALGPSLGSVAPIVLVAVLQEVQLAFDMRSGDSTNQVHAYLLPCLREVSFREVFSCTAQADTYARRGGSVRIIGRRLSPTAMLPYGLFSMFQASGYSATPFECVRRGVRHVRGVVRGVNASMRE